MARSPTPRRLRRRLLRTLRKGDRVVAGDPAVVLAVSPEEAALVRAMFLAPPVVGRTTGDLIFTMAVTEGGVAALETILQRLARRQAH